MSQERTLITTVRVRYPEVDRMGLAHHSAYLLWFEIGRTELIREAGLSYRELEEKLGVLLPLIEVVVHYRAPARYDDLLTIRTSLLELGGVRIRFGYRIDRDAQVLAEGHTIHATCGRTGQPRRLPRELKEMLLSWSSMSA